MAHLGEFPSGINPPLQLSFIYIYVICITQVVKNKKNLKVSFRRVLLNAVSSSFGLFHFSFIFTGSYPENFSFLAQAVKRFDFGELIWGVPRQCGTHNFVCFSFSFQLPTHYENSTNLV